MAYMDKSAFAAWMISKYVDHLDADDEATADVAEAMLVDMITYTHDCGVRAAREILSVLASADD